VAVIAAAAAGVTPILSAALVGVVALLALRVLTPTEARNAINFEVIVVIASALGLAAASQSSGLSDQIAAILVGGLGDLGPIAALAGILFSTVAMTVMITNTASAALIFPIAMSTAQGVGVDPRVFAVALAVVASGSFLTPIGYQTNTMVYGPGGYRFSDYSRLGAPLILTVVATVLFLTWLRL
jgi:di/tricarboxylate transporter